MLICTECGARFYEPELVPEKTGVYADGGFSETVWIEVCPWCGCEDMEDYDEI